MEKQMVAATENVRVVRMYECINVVWLVLVAKISWFDSLQKGVKCIHKKTPLKEMIIMLKEYKCPKCGREIKTNQSNPKCYECSDKYKKNIYYEEK